MQASEKKKVSQGNLAGNIAILVATTIALVAPAGAQTWQSLGKSATIPGLGVGQTWQDVTTARALGVTYTNSTGKPIQISILLKGINNADDRLVIYVNGVPAGGVWNQYGYQDSWAQAVVPNGSTYIASHNGPAFYVSGWYELR